MKLKNLCKGLDVSLTPALAETNIKSLAIDSRDVKAGSLFIAIRGFISDGHDFIIGALKNGAEVIIAEKSISEDKRVIVVKDTRKALSLLAKNFYGSPSEKLKVIGITGTNGKTTVSLLAESIFKTARMPCGLIGTVEYRIGKTRIPAERTTPDALSINEMLYKMLKNGSKAVVMEISSHALDQKRVDDISFDAAIFTNLTHEHLDYHGDMDRYFASKVKIFQQIKKEGVAIINMDDRKIADFKKNISCRKITFGMDKTAEVSAEIKKADLNGTDFKVTINERTAVSMNTKLIGRHNVSNILAAIALGVSQGIPLDKIKTGISKVNRIPGRLDSVQKGQGFRVFIDYAHTHNALENVLNFLNEVKKGKIITVFGCGGNRDREKRPLMGEVAERLSDYVILTNDNPRSEEPQNIIHDIEKGMSGKSKHIVIPDRQKAIEKALKEANDSDIVLLAGKGHEKTQIIGERVMPFDDKKVAEEILLRRTMDDGRKTKRFN